MSCRCSVKSCHYVNELITISTFYVNQKMFVTKLTGMVFGLTLQIYLIMHCLNFLLEFYGTAQNVLKLEGNFFPNGCGTWVCIWFFFCLGCSQIFRPAVVNTVIFGNMV